MTKKCQNKLKPKGVINYTQVKQMSVMYQYAENAQGQKIFNAPRSRNETLADISMPSQSPLDLAYFNVCTVYKQRLKMYTQFLFGFY